MKSTKEILKDYQNKMLELGQFSMTVMEATEKAEATKTYLCNLQIDYKKALESEQKQAALDAAKAEVKNVEVVEAPIVQDTVSA